MPIITHQFSRKYARYRPFGIYNMSDELRYSQMFIQKLYVGGAFCVFGIRVCLSTCLRTCGLDSGQMFGCARTKWLIAPGAHLLKYVKFKYFANVRGDPQTMVAGRRRSWGETIKIFAMTFRRLLAAIYGLYQSGKLLTGSNAGHFKQDCLRKMIN